MDFKTSIAKKHELIQKLFLEDSLPWVIGYSGGKDSTAALQLVWNAMLGLPEDKRMAKPIYVISTDTLVESPIIAKWVNISLERMQTEANKEKLPFKVNQLIPKLTDTFWVNLIGKGYAAPRNLFRWCTSRLKIDPSNTFIQNVVTEYGELFFRYWFKKLGSEESSEKLTYAKLYTDYDWIIAMGIHIDDMQKYIAQTSAESEKVAFMLSLRLVFLLMGLVVAALGLVFMFEQFHLKATTTRLRYEMNKDPVTGVCSRRCGTNKLTASFEEFQITGLSPAIVLFDFDRFKAINDTYGHTVGDQVLKSVVDAVQRSIRVSDEVIRWGGDEFVVILEGLEKGNVAAFCNKILKTVSSLEVVVADEVIRPSVSLGASYFHASDETFLDALRRADRAMYRGKQAGRNKVEVLL